VDDALATQAVLLLFGGALLGGIVGAGTGLVLGRMRRGDAFMPGLAVGLLVFGGCTAFGAARLGWAAWQFERGTVAAQGRLLGYEEQFDTDSRGRRTRTLAPRVEFAAADGTRHSILGLGGSQPDLEEGAAVPVRYRPEAPQRAAVDDFQNRWGAFWAFSGFAGFGLLAGLFFAVSVWSAGRPRLARQRRAGPRAMALRRLLIPTAGLTLVASLLTPALDASNSLERGLAIGFGGVAAAMLLYAAAVLLTPERERGQPLMILLIIAAGFAFFAFGLWQMQG
jgi:hypothetical protein